MPEVVEKDIVKHLSNLQNKFDRYFPETSDEELDFVKNPFTFPVEKLSDECQDEFSELINDFGAGQVPRKTFFTLLGWIERFIPSNNRNGSSYSYPFCINLPMRIRIFVSTSN